MTAAPKRTTRTAVVARGPEKATTRVHREAAELEAHTPQRLLEGYRAKAKAHVNTLPLHAWRHWRKWSDYTLPLTLALLAVFLYRFPGLAIWPSWIFITGHVWHLGRLGSLLFLAGSGYCFTHFWHIGDHHTRRKSHRRTVRNARPVVTACTPELIPIDWQPDQHKTVLVARLPHGTSVDDYRKQAPRLETKLRTPVTIRPAGPGKITVTQHLYDVLADIVQWREATPDRPDIPIGINNDGQLVTWNPHARSLLVAGMKGSGKSAFLKALAVNLLHQNHPLGLIDLEGGPNFGRFRKQATDLALNPEDAIRLLHQLDRDREKELVKLSGDDAPDAAEHLSYVLMIDELSLLTHRSRPCSKETLPILENMLARGRKPGFTLIAATQYPEVAVIPELLRGQFDNVLGLRTARTRQTNVIFGDGAIADGINLKTINPGHQGRGWWHDGADTHPVRVAGLYGGQLRQALSNLGAQPVQTDLYVPSEWSQPVPGDTPWPAPPHDLTVTDDISDYVSNDDCDGALRIAATRAGVHGVHLPTFVAETGFGKRRVGRAAHRLRLVDLQGRPGWWADREAVR